MTLSIFIVIILYPLDEMVFSNHSEVHIKHSPSKNSLHTPYPIHNHLFKVIYRTIFCYIHKDVELFFIRLYPSECKYLSVCYLEPLVFFNKVWVFRKSLESNVVSYFIQHFFWGNMLHFKKTPLSIKEFSILSMRLLMSILRIFIINRFIMSFYNYLCKWLYLQQCSRSLFFLYLF